jgi:hypothetical protein
MVGMCLIILCLGISAQGQKFWEKKSYEQWSCFEVIKMLIDSPWGKMQSPTYNDHPINIRLHSALPIRQALVRGREIKLARLKITALEQSQFDSEAKELLECADCQRYYILSLQPNVRSEKIIRALSRWSFDSLKSSVSLENDTGAIRPLVKFLPLQSMGETPLFMNNSLFFFERIDDQGNPFISPANKTFYLRIDEKAFKGTDIVLRRVKFEVSRLTQKGQVQF